ncbi:MAG: phosphoesterase [Sulfurimonas sp.]|nr:phosphoesterase [Sulfurimonas sp.]
MNDIIEKILNANHIVIDTDISNITGASALYTYIIRLHKKVSLVCMEKDDDKKLSKKYAFLPWFEKVRALKPQSADCFIDFNESCISMYEFFSKNNIKINPKMATALYAGLLQESEGFSSKIVDGTIFAMARELIDCGAEYKTCTKYILKTTSLSFLRLKSKMLSEMLLENEASASVFTISSDDLKASGANIVDCEEVLKESLMLQTVEIAVLLDLDNNNETIKLICKES